MDIAATPPESNQNSKNFSLSQRLFWLGLSLLFLGGGLLLFILAPALKQEWHYWQRTNFESEVKNVAQIKENDHREMPLTPIDTQFGIVIPKIEANARVMAEVDWQDARVYQEALRHGVAHAQGTALPGQAGNTFIFAHSGVDFSEAARYNAVFYLMNKLVAGDEIRIFYEGQEYLYQVTETKKVASEAVEYLDQDLSKKTLTLMTCWPAGTTLKRLIVQAELKTP